MSMVIGITGFSGVGKTTLIERLLPLIQQAHYRVAVMKSTHHDVDVDKPGKDSYRFREAGADAVVLAAAKSSMLLLQHEENQQVSMPSLLDMLAVQQYALVLFEGFKHCPYDKILLHRQCLGEFPYQLIDRHTIAIACESELDLKPRQELLNMSRLDINNIQAIATFILNRLPNDTKS